MSLAENRVALEIQKNIEKVLLSSGLMYRLFSRAKSPQSVKIKLDDKSDMYKTEKRKMQDLIGLRIVVYFADDQKICEKIVNRLYNRVEDSIDKFKSDTFGPTRWNVIYRLPPNLSEQIQTIRENVFIDDTFEVQFRTILSEGWHEVDHDLRYKCKDEWEGHQDLSRALNGILATLEISDWSILKIFDELAYRNYKSKDWCSLIRNKFRVRLLDGKISDDIIYILNSNTDIGKAIFRYERDDLLNQLVNIPSLLPITANNIIFILNRETIGNSDIMRFEPRPVKEILERTFTCKNNL